MSGTEEQRIKETEREMDATAEDMAQRSEQVDEQIADAKQGWEKAKADTSIPTASGDWEDSEPDDSSEDAGGFDDPEDVDLDDDDDLLNEDEERLPDE